mmetsp:Transcript_16770/g.56335  ORF Transcript_16770/g.56335 Transcript_16770/m.56335 type:complete len:238 (-) Transcript_16770:1042-1755(-)
MAEGRGLVQGQRCAGATGSSCATSGAHRWATRAATWDRHRRHAAKRRACFSQARRVQEHGLDVRCSHGAKGGCRCARARGPGAGRGCVRDGGRHAEVSAARECARVLSASWFVLRGRRQRWSSRTAPSRLGAGRSVASRQSVRSAARQSGRSRVGAGGARRATEVARRGSDARRGGGRVQVKNVWSPPGVARARRCRGAPSRGPRHPPPNAAPAVCRVQKRGTGGHVTGGSRVCRVG